MSDDYEIGHGKPPKNTRFIKGQSGNPKGRPKGAKNMATVLAEELAEMIDITEGGVKKRVSKLQAIIKSLVAKAAKGDIKAATLVFDKSDRPLHEDKGQSGPIPFTIDLGNLKNDYDYDDD